MIAAVLQGAAACQGYHGKVAGTTATVKVTNPEDLFIQVGAR